MSKKDGSEPSVDVLAILGTGMPTGVCTKGMRANEHPWSELNPWGGEAIKTARCVCWHFERLITKALKSKGVKTNMKVPSADQDHGLTTTKTAGTKTEVKSTQEHTASSWHGAGSGTTTWVSCAAKPGHVFTVGDTAVWASGYNNLTDVSDVVFGAIFCLNGRSFPKPNTLTLGKVAEKLLPGVFKFSKQADPDDVTVKINWPDMSTPTLPKAFWDTLVADLLVEKPPRVIVYCEGGKGRTGTFLACLAGIAAKVGALKSKSGDPVSAADLKALDVVKWVREVHHKNAVESKGQKDYVYNITGFNTEESGSKDKK